MHPAELAPTTDGTTIDITGLLRGRTNAACTLEFFANPAPHPSGYGEGEAYLGSASVTTDESGQAPIQTRLPSLGPAWSWLSATATYLDGSTSAFSLTQMIRSTTRLQIHTQPASAGVRPGSNAVLRVEASGATPITYQWRRNGVSLLAATNATLSLTNLQPGQGGLFTVFLTNPFGTELSQPAAVVVMVSPIFVQQPLSQTAAPGELVTFSVAVHDDATPPLSFGWRSNTTFIAATGPGPETTSFLTVRAGSSTMAYGVVVTNAVIPGGLGSATATLTVAPDRDQDGLPDSYETAKGLNPDDPADAGADTDADGVTNKQEYFAGTDLQDPLSYLKVDRLSNGPGGVLLEFAAASRKTYSVHYSDGSPGLAWLTLTNLAATSTNRLVKVVDPGPSQHRFYRLATPGGALQ